MIPPHVHHLIHRDPLVVVSTCADCGEPSHPRRPHMAAPLVLCARCGEIILPAAPRADLRWHPGCRAAEQRALSTPGSSETVEVAPECLQADYGASRGAVRAIRAATGQGWER